MTLTKAALLEHAKTRFEWVEVPNLGRVGLQSVSNVQASRRDVEYGRDKDSLAHAMAHMIIDQVMVGPGKPMFTESDVDTLDALDPAKLAPLYEAIERFNGNGQKKASGGSSDTSTN